MSEIKQEEHDDNLPLSLDLRSGMHVAPQLYTWYSAAAEDNLVAEVTISNLIMYHHYNTDIFI
jgi:hypothetical protein